MAILLVTVWMFLVSADWMKLLKVPSDTLGWLGVIFAIVIVLITFFWGEYVVGVPRRSRSTSSPA